MKLIDVQVDGFGVWSSLQLQELSPLCTVFYGPNEAGKTTLLQFLRSVMYGFSAERRTRYLPPVQGGAAGGWLTVCMSEKGRKRIRRQDDEGHSIGAVTIESADGMILGDGELQHWLHDVDELTYQNVFAVGLHELQELGTLNDTEAAQWLYTLAAGRDRVSLCDVLRELEHSRSRLLADVSQPSQIGDLLQERDRLRQELDNLSSLSGSYGRLIAEQVSSHAEIAQLEDSIAKQEVECQIWETTVLVYEDWQRRSALQSQIDSLGPPEDWPVDAVARMDRLSQDIRRRQRRLRRTFDRRRQWRSELDKLELNELLWRQSARIAVLAEHEAWIVSLEQDLGQAEAAVRALLDERQTRLQQLQPAAVNANLGSAESAYAAEKPNHTWATLKRPAAKLMRARRKIQAAQRKIDEQRAAAEVPRRELQLALATSKQPTLTAALEVIGQRVTELRHRLQSDERMERLAHTKTDLETQVEELLARQILPAWMLVALGGVFALGVVLFLAGLLLPGSFIGGLGWPMAWLGLLGTGAAVAAKYGIERSLANRLENSRRQLASIESQLEQTQSEQEDSALQCGGSAQPLLQTAEQELARLESLMPLESQRQGAEHAALAAESQLKEADQNLTQAQKNWQTALAAVGLSTSVWPHEARAMIQAHSQVGQIERQLATARIELEKIRRELSVLSSRIDQVFVAIRLQPESKLASEQLRELRRRLDEEENRRRRQDDIMNKRRRLLGRQRRMLVHLRQLKRRRRQLLKACQVLNIAEFKRRAEQCAQIDHLMLQRDTANHEIAAALSSVATEAEIAQRLVGKSLSQVEAALAVHTQHRDEVRATLHRLLEERGRRGEQLRQLANDKRPAVKRFELSQVEHQLAGALRRWQLLTVTQRILQQIKDDYERHRQPETLREASEYLTQFTAGRYARVWTRYGENALLVDDHAGQSLPIEFLSHGTREQLFLALRMALVGLFARRGAVLPMVLDDVLVNFDSERAAAAVDALRQFAQRGHQLLVFTCHEHLARLFQSRRVDVRRLPDRSTPGSDQSFEPEVEPPPRRIPPRQIREDERHEVAVSAPPPAPAGPVTMPAAPTATPLEAESSIQNAVISPPAKLRQRLRVDRPQRPIRRSPIMRRWGAEEFSGELDDRVNPTSLLNSGTANLKVFDEESVPIVLDPAAGNEDWEL